MVYLHKILENVLYKNIFKIHFYWMDVNLILDVMFWLLLRDHYLFFFNMDIYVYQ